MHARADVPEHDADLPRRHPAAAVGPDWAGAPALPRVSARTGTGIRAVTPQAALALQRTAGNRATGRLLSAARSPAAVMSAMSAMSEMSEMTATSSVQRDDDEPPTVASPLRSTVKL